MRNITEKTLITALVNYKCVGKLGLRGLSKKERSYVVDTIIDDRKWIDDDMNITAKGNEVARENLSFLQY